MGCTRKGFACIPLFGMLLLTDFRAEGNTFCGCLCGPRSDCVTSVWLSHWTGIQQQQGHRSPSICSPEPMPHLFSYTVERQGLTLPSRSLGMPHPNCHRRMAEPAQLPAGLDILTVLGAHEGEGLVVEHDAAVAGSGSSLLRDKGQRVDAKIVEVALFFQQEMLGAGQESPAAPGQQAAPLEQVLGQVQERSCDPGQKDMPAGQEPQAAPALPMQQAAVLAPPAVQQQAGLSGMPGVGQAPTALSPPDAAVRGQGRGAGRSTPTTLPAESLQQAALPGQELGAGQATLPDQPTAQTRQGHLECGHQETGPEVAESGDAPKQPAAAVAGSLAPALAGSAAAAASAEQRPCGSGDRIIGDEGSEGNTANLHLSVASTRQHGASHGQISQRPDETPMATSAAGRQKALATDAEAGAEVNSAAKVSTERGPNQIQQNCLGPESAAASEADSHAAQEALQSASSLQQQQGLSLNNFSQVALGSSPQQAGGLQQQQQQQESEGQSGLGSDSASQSAPPLRAASRTGQQAAAPLPQAGSAQQASRPVAHQAAAAKRLPLPAQHGDASAAAPNVAVEGVPAEGAPAPAHGKQAAQGADEKQWPVLLLSNDNAQLQLAKSHG